MMRQGNGCRQLEKGKMINQNEQLNTKEKVKGNIYIWEKGNVKI